MRLSDRDIESRVTVVITALLNGVKIRSEDKPIISAGIDLITNILININDIANKP